MEPADTTVDITREAGAGSMSPASSGSPFFRLPEVGDVYLWHTGHRVVVTAVEGAMSYVRWSGQTTGNMRMPVATGLLAAVAPVKANAAGQGAAKPYPAPACSAFRIPYDRDDERYEYIEQGHMFVYPYDKAGWEQIIRHDGLPGKPTSPCFYVWRRARRPNNAVRGAAEPRTLDGLVGDSER